MLHPPHVTNLITQPTKQLIVVNTNIICRPPEQEMCVVVGRKNNNKQMSTDELGKQG